MAKTDRGSSGPKTSTASPDGEEGFLGRWSRRKAEAKTPSDRAEVDTQDEQDAELTNLETDQVDQPPVAVDPATLPDIDKMDAKSDYSMFMQAGVPAELKTKALRKLWRVKPELANLDGLIDYGEDLTGSFKVVDHLKTAYEVGKGFLKDEKDQAKEELQAEPNGAEEIDLSAKSEEVPKKINQKNKNQDQQEMIAKDETAGEKPAKG